MNTGANVSLRLRVSTSYDIQQFYEQTHYLRMVFVEIALPT